MPDLTDLMPIVIEALAGLDAPIAITDNRYSHRRPISHDPIAMVCDSPPAYHVQVCVNWQPGYVRTGPWVSVTHTGRFGFTPMNDGYTYLTPPAEVDESDPEAVTAWLTPALREAVARHAPEAAAAKAAETDKPGPHEAWDAVRRLGDV